MTDTDKLIETMNARHARGKPQEPAGTLLDRWVEDIENRVIAARYSSQNVVSNAEALKLTQEIRALRHQMKIESCPPKGSRTE